MSDHPPHRELDGRRRPAISRDAEGLHITMRGLTYAASVLAFVAAAWTPLKAVWRLTELPAAVTQLGDAVTSLNAVLTKFGGRVDVVERDVADLKGLAPRVQQLETRAAGIDAAKGAADALHERQERRITTLEQERRRGGGL